jgi:ABC-2 type transport system ATP-binding protein
MGYFPFDRKREFLKRIGLVMGNKTGLEWDLTPIQNFELIRKIYAIESVDYRDRLSELTELLTVSELLDTQVRKLSLGERMKMELIASILHNPDVLFLDEPTIGLDILSKQKVREFLRQIQKNSEITLLLTSHDMADVEKVCDRVIVINKGKKVYDDEISQLLSKYTKNRYIELFFKKIPEKQELRYLGKEIERSESSVVLAVESAKLPSVLSKATTDFKLMDIDILSVPLDEIIADIFRKS